jgi:hypothetical protein
MTLAVASPAGTLTLVRNGKAVCEIRIEANASPAVKHGAEELQSYLKRISGADVPLQVGDAPRHRGVATIVVRQNPKLAAEELHIQTAPGSLLIEGGGSRGAMYGCYAFLEEVLGCRWFTTRITRVPAKRTIALASLAIDERPAFEYREPFYFEAFDRDWAAHNRVNGNSMRLDETVGGGVKYGRFVHTFAELVPPEKYYDEHPEYFSMIDGKRMKGYYQLCLTNPDVLRIATDKVRQWIKENPNATIFSVSQNDAGGYCQCDKCKAVQQEEGAPSGVLLRFVNAVAEQIGKEYPNVLIDTLAYQWSENPPKLVRPLPNVRIRLAPIDACFGHPLDGCDFNKHSYGNLRSWAKITNQLYIWHYSTNFANYLQPLPDLDEIARDIPIFKQNGVVGLFYEGDYADGGCGEMSGLKAYLMAKLMWNVNQPAGPIIDDYLLGVYGNAAPMVHEWLDLLHKSVRAGTHARIYDNPGVSYLKPSIIADGLKLFDEAARAVASEPDRLEEVSRARLALEYVALEHGLGRWHEESAEEKEATKALAGVVLGKIDHFGIGQIREGQPVQDYKKHVQAVIAGS